MKNRIVTLRDFPDKHLESEWREFLRRAEYASHYVSPEFFLEPFFHKDNRIAILALQNDQVTGVITGVIEGKQLVCGLVPRPQVSLSNNSNIETERLLARGLLNVSHSSGVVTVYAWKPLTAFVELGFRQQKEEGVVMLDLSREPAALMKDFSESRRRNIRKAIRSGKLDIQEARTKTDYEIYYPIYAAWCKRKKQPAVTFESFEKSFKLRNSRRLFLARYQGEVIAGVVVRFYPNGMMEYAANSSSPEFLNLRPNDLLHWRIIEWAYSQGLSHYSLGGTHSFLTRFGGTIVPTYRLRADRSFLRRHDRLEDIGKLLRPIGQSLPVPAKQALRRLVHKLRR